VEGRDEEFNIGLRAKQVPRSLQRTAQRAGAISNTYASDDYHMIILVRIRKTNVYIRFIEYWKYGRT
jgi:hypothetical protein